MIDMVAALTAAAEQVHRTHCDTCCTMNPGDCQGFDEIDKGIAAAVIDKFITHCYNGVRHAVWDAHRTING